MDHSILNQHIERALQLQQTNQVEDAIQLFKKILSRYPKQADALHGLGLCYIQKKDFIRGLNYLTQAVVQAPTIPAFHNNLANAYKVTGQLDLAKTHYLEALRLKSPYSEAHNNLGSIHYLQGDYEKAIIQFKKALRINPNLWDAHFNLANCYIKKDLFLDAKPHLENVLTLRPDHLGAINNLAILYCLLKQFDKAKPLLQAVIEREPNNIEILFHLGLANASTHNLIEAQHCYLRLLALDENHDRAHHNLATLYLHLDDKKNALKHYEKSYMLNKHNQTALHMTKALKGETLKEGAPYEYTRALFDQYAYTYNQHVKETLNYQVPHLLRKLIHSYAEKKNKPWQVLDLGCGTGLCAPYFIDISDKLYGVDLSPNMISEAAKLGAYYKLAVEDIYSFLSKTLQKFDLIIAADVFGYFGELKAILEACYKTLNTDGYYLFSIENILDSDIKTGYQLGETGRYCHHSAYVQSLAAEIGFTICEQQDAVLRIQEKNNVKGTLFLLQKKDNNT